MKIKTSELSGIALDWAVAKCEGIMVNVHYGFRGNYIVYNSDVYKPSSNWSQGGPIIEREGIGFHRNGKRTFSNDAMRYEANVIKNQDGAPICRVGYRGKGPTPLIAAMRCYVASKMGKRLKYLTN